MIFRISIRLQFADRPPEYCIRAFGDEDTFADLIASCEKIVDEHAARDKVLKCSCRFGDEENWKNILVYQPTPKE